MPNTLSDLTAAAVPDTPRAALKLAVAPTGARRSKADHPRIPITLPEICAAARRCHQAGAGEIHLHIRDRDGRHSLDPGAYREALQALGETVPKMSVQASTESAGRFGPAEQLAVIRESGSRAASVSIREMARDRAIAARLYAIAAERGISVQHILYDIGDLALLRDWRHAGTIPRRMRDILLVLGRYAPQTDARPGDLAPFVAALGAEFPDWSVCAFGAGEHAVALEALRLGGHVRVGFENNIHRPDGSLATDNAENVRRIAQAARAFGRPPLIARIPQ